MITPSVRLKNNQGFTLVELLIVIVVISILASISVVAYSGMQKRATETKISTIVNSYSKLLQMYHVEHGQYPIRSPEVCLGNASDFPADPPFDAGACLRRVSTGEMVNTTDAALMNDLSVYGNIPDSILPTSSYWGSEDWRGLRYFGHDGSYALIEWMANGRSDCAPGNTFGSDDDYTMCQYWLRS